MMHGINHPGSVYELGTNSDIPDVGHSKTDMGVRGGKPTVAEALKRGVSRTLTSCVAGTPYVSSWLSVVICESYTSSSDGSTAGSSVASWGAFSVGSLIFIPALTTWFHETSVDLHMQYKLHVQQQTLLLQKRIPILRQATHHDARKLP
jgi:hypothetical protein